MNFVKLRLTILFVLVCNIALSQTPILIYTTYQDFVNQTPKQYEDLKDYLLAENLTLKVVKNNNIEKIRVKDIWGFVYKDAFFRIDHDDPRSMITRLVSTGKLFYYENGIPHLQMLFHDTDSASYRASYGYTAYISTALDSDMAPLSTGTNLLDRKRAKKRRKEFRETNINHEEFFKCLRNYSIETLRRCITKYNETVDSK